MSDILRLPEEPESGPAFDLTCWYINQRRVMELVGDSAVSGHLGSRGGSEHLDKLRELAAFKQAMTEWLQTSNPPTLGQLMTQRALRPGMIFTHYTNWISKGLPELERALAKGKVPLPPAMTYSKLGEFDGGMRVECRFHHEHLTSVSAWSELKGQKRLLVVGLVTDISGSTIEAIPYVIANPTPAWARPTNPIGKRWPTRLECFVDVIDSFSLVQSVERPTRISDLAPLKDISEYDVKTAFAEILGEAIIPDDWGGERSDLFSTNVMLEGKRISTAFAFKGPAQFRRMTMAQLGKNGDQIDRLFSEPADLLVLQHCHEIAPSVRGAMRAYAQRMGDLRLFCLIDGFDTLRILQAYNKCGLRR